MATYSSLDPNDPINILLMPFDQNQQRTVPTPADSAAEAARAAAAAQAAAEDQRQRQAQQQHAEALRHQQASKAATVFGGAEGEVLYESNVRPSQRSWQSSNRVEVKRTVVDYAMSDPLPPQVQVPDGATVLAQRERPPPVPRPGASPVNYSTAIQVHVAAEPALESAPQRLQVPASPRLQRASPRASPRPQTASPRLQTASPRPQAASPRPGTASPGLAVFSPTAGVHPHISQNKTEEFMTKVNSGKAKVRQCPSFRMLEFQLEYEEYKEAKNAEMTAVS